MSIARLNTRFNFSKAASNTLNLLVITVVERAVCDTEVCFDIMSVGVLAITLEQAKSSNEIALLQKVVGIGKFQFLLFTQTFRINNHVRGYSKEKGVWNGLNW